ncbi:hypothetical protein B566_EDAN017660, partial [Ephemera danica]
GVASRDRRLKYISGFSVSEGIAVVTNTSAVLWVDSQYYMQADAELACFWLIMRPDLPQVPSIPRWLRQQLRSGARVGTDPRLIAHSSWVDLESDLAKVNISLVSVEANLIDHIWTRNRPQYSKNTSFVHALKYAGEAWESKVQRVRAKLKELGAEAQVITALDEVAWLLNIRGVDAPFVPVVRAYVLLAQDTIDMYIPGGAAGVSDAVGEKKLPHSSPILMIKSVKNDVEIKGMRQAHVRDAAALCLFMAYLEDMLETGKEINESYVATTVDAFRLDQPLSEGASFRTIAGYGKNGALPHYRPKAASALRIKDDSTLVLDSGGQYLDGTTDVTRTLHFGKPTSLQREAYTRNALNYNVTGPYLTFRAATLVPYEPKLINIDLLTPDLRKMLNDYNARVRIEVGPELKKKNDLKGFRWMMNKTGYIPEWAPPKSSSYTLRPTLIFLTLCSTVALFCHFT